MLKKVILPLILSLIISAGCKKAVMMEYKPSGEEVKYKFTMESKTTAEGDTLKEVTGILNRTITMNMNISQKILATTEKNLLSNDITIEEGEIKDSAEEQVFQDKGKKINIKMKRNGEFLNISDKNFESIPQIVLSDKPAGSGDKWSSKVKYLNKMFEANYILEKFEKINGNDYAVINLEMPENMFEADGRRTKITMKGNIYFDYNKGRLLSSYIEKNIIVETINTNDKLKMNQITEIKTR